MLSRRNIITAVFFALPILFFFYTICTYSVNVPIVDDFESIFDFLNKFYSFSGLGDKTGLFFSQHNEHRLVFNRVVTLLAHGVMGAVDLKLLILFGNLAQVGIFVVLLLSYRKNSENNILYFLPAVLLLFQFEYHQGINWAMASISNFYVVFFAFLSLYLLAFSNAVPSFLAAAAFAGLAAFTQGGGLLVWITGQGVLIVKKEYRKAAAWAFLAALVFGLYFYGYEKPAHHPDGIKLLFTEPLLPVRYFLSVLGSPFPAPEVCGAISSVVFIAITIKGYYKRNIAAYSFMLFLFITVAAASFSRSGLGIEQSLSSRYKIIPALILILYYIAFLELMGAERVKRAFAAVILVLSIAFNAHAYIKNIDALKAQKTVSLYRMFKWETTGQDVLMHPDKARATVVLSESIKRGFYATPDPAGIEARLEGAVLPQADREILYAVENLYYGPAHIVVEGWAFIDGRDSKGSSIYIELGTGGKKYLFGAVARKRPDLGDRFSGAEDSGFFCVIPRRYLENGIYTVAIHVINDKTGGYGLTGATVLNGESDPY